MERKGNISVSAIIVIVIVAVLLVIVFTSVFPWLAGKIELFKFSFKQDNETTKGFNILRYDLDNGKVEYYDGNNFLDFSGKDIKLREGNLNYDNIKASFDDYVKDEISLVIYDGEIKLVWNEGRNYGIEIKLRQKEEIKKMIENGELSVILIKRPNEPEIYFRYITADSPAFGWEWSFNRFNWRNSYSIEASLCKVGDRDIGGRNCEDIKKLRELSRTAGLLILRGGDNLQYSYGVSFIDLPYHGEIFYVGYNGELYKEDGTSFRAEEYGIYELFFREEALKWKESVLKKPVAISMAIPLQPLYVCAEFFDNRYLIVRLNKEVGEGDLC